MDDKKLAKRLLKPYYFTDRNLEIGFNIYSEGHHISHAKSKLTIKTNFSEFGIDFRYSIEFLRDG